METLVREEKVRERSRLSDISLPKHDFSEEKKKILQIFDALPKDENYWKTPYEIAKLIHCSLKEINKIIDTLDELVKNEKGYYTTRNLYNDRTPFFVKLLHSYQGEIK